MVVNLTKAEILLHRARDGSEVPRRQHLACSLALRDGRLDSCSRIGTRVPGCIQRAAGGEQVRACHGGDGWKIPPRRFVIEEVEKLVFDKGTPQADSRLMPNVLGIESGKTVASVQAAITEEPVAGSVNIV